MSESDIRDALARRLHRTKSDTNHGVKLAQVGGIKLEPSSIYQADLSTCVASSLESSCPRLDGYLYKYSSGHLSRWQKRYFVLGAGKFSYFKRLPLEKDVANKSFSVVRIKSVTAKEGPGADDREFSLVFANGKAYQMRAPTNEDKRKWVNSLKSAIALMESCTEGRGYQDEDAGMSDDGVDGMTSINGSVVSESSPRNPKSPSHEHYLSAKLHVLLPRRESITGVLHMAANGLTSLKPTIPGLVPDTSMLEVEIDPDALDKNFEEWFYFISTQDTKVQMSQILDACRRSNNHLWSTLANLPRGAEIKLEEAVGRAKARMGAQAAIERASIIVQEYLSRISKSVGRALEMVRSSSKSSSSSDLPQLMDLVAKMYLSIDKLLPLPLETRCVCCYCDPSGVAVLKLERAHGGKKALIMPPVMCSTDKWRKCIRSVLQRTGGEIEVGLIEELQQHVTSAEVLWNTPSCAQASQHPLLDDMHLKSAVIVKVSLTGFAPAFVQAAQATCLNAAIQWMAAYPSSARLVAEHSSSALVASINSVWRTFKRQAGLASERAAEEQFKKYSEATRTCREELLKRKETFTDFSHLVAFANEAVLLSRFCAKTWSNGVSSKFTPDVFLTCMEGLATGFLTTATDVCHSIVLLHLTPRVKFDLVKLFSQKNLIEKKNQTPMIHAKITAERFISALDISHAIPCVRDAVVALVAQALLRAYIHALVKNKPRVKALKTLPDMLKADLDLFRSFADKTLHIPPSQLSSPFQVAQEMQDLMMEENRSNFSIHFNTIAKLVDSPQDAFIAVSAFLKIREHEWTLSSEKKEIASIVSTMKSTVASGAKKSQDEVADEMEKPATDMHEPQVRKGKNGVITITLSVGDLKAPWRLEE